MAACFEWKLLFTWLVANDVFDGVFLCCPFFPQDVLDEILNLTESVSEGFLPTLPISSALDVQIKGHNSVSF